MFCYRKVNLKKKKILKILCTEQNFITIREKKYNGGISARQNIIIRNELYQKRKKKTRYILYTVGLSSIDLAMST